MNDLTIYHPVVARIVGVLTEKGCTFKTFEHEPVRTSEEAAAVRPEYSLAQGAKALIIRAKMRETEGGEVKTFAQVVVPGDARFDSRKTREVLGAKDIRFAFEEEVHSLTGGIIPGGVPPFGNLFGLAVYADETLLANEEIIFNAGDRRFSIALKTTDYIRVVEPRVVSIIV